MSERQSHVVPLAEARAGLSATLRSFRQDPDARPVFLGSHRKPEAVILSTAAYERATRGDRTVTLARLKDLSGVLARLAAASNLHDIRVFGSVARGEATEASDVDLLVTPSEATTLFDIAQFELDVEAVLGRPVSAVPVTALTDRDAAVLAESVAL